MYQVGEELGCEALLTKKTEEICKRNEALRKRHEVGEDILTKLGCEALLAKLGCEALLTKLGCEAFLAKLGCEALLTKKWKIFI